MFCDACGSAIQPGQSFCPRCGKAIVGTVAAGGSRVAQHAKLLGILWIVYSVLHVLGGVLMLVVANTIFLHAPGMQHGPTFLQPLISAIGIFVLAKGAAGVAGGWGLLQREPWARTITLVVAFVSLIDIPFGTALGIYSIWVLMSRDGEQAYRSFAGVGV